MRVSHDLDQYLDHFARRVTQDALQEASSSYWLARAEALEAALPRPGDHPGEAPDPDRETRLRAAIAACRNKALLLKRGVL